MMALRGLVPWFIGLVALGWIGAANGQTFPVTAGEHPDFTRVVVHAPPGTSWSLTKVAENHLLSVAPSTAGFDLTRLFDRIPRTRLAGARSEPGLLTLNIPCNCGTNAWEERPGLIVIDITNRIEPTQAQPPPSPAAVAAVDPARAAGIALAQAHALEQMQMDTPPEEPPLPSLDALTETLGRPIAQALGQGLLEPATSRGSAPPVLLRPGADAPVDLPENMRIATATDRPDPSAPPASEPRDTCVGAEALDFLLAPATGDFGTTFGRLTRELYGEFDQPRPDIRRALIQHYLSSGFGAEARALIENDSDPVSGRESLLGMSDLLEDRNSNSRLRLAQMIGCTGPTTLLAALAGAPDADIRRSASDIALTFTELDPPLRSILGQDLARRLIEVGATDAARIVIGSTRRSPWSNALELDILEAQLERALGHPADAIARLAHLQGASAQSLQAQLDLALETDSPVSAALLSEAEALASAHRNAAAGPDLMDAIIRLHARDRSFQIGFDALDRLRAWFPENSGAQSRISDLRDDLWGAIAKEGDDLALMHTILNRAD
ncbi:MAG: hypothetical protein KJZ59_02085, partial [Pararhodobacter sp.]|nr:hypothetical protein [Pararhodobacter sp.]